MTDEITFIEYKFSHSTPDGILTYHIYLVNGKEYALVVDCYYNTKLLDEFYNEVIDDDLELMLYRLVMDRENGFCLLPLEYQELQYEH